MEASRSDRWLALLAESDESLAGLSGSDDPVARRQVAEALNGKAKALSNLERPLEAIEAWDELLRVYAVDTSEGAQRKALVVLSRKALDLVRAGQSSQAVETVDALLALSGVQTPELVPEQRLILSALMLKRGALPAAQPEAIAAVDQEIIARFGSSADPVSHRQVTSVLVQIGAMHLLAKRIDDALAAGHQLGERLGTASDEYLADEAELLNAYAKALLAFGGPGWRAVAEGAAFLATNAAMRFARRYSERLDVFRVRELAAVSRAVRRAACRKRGRWAEARLRIGAAIELHEQVLDAVGSDPDLRLQAAATEARVRLAYAHIVTGHVKEGLEEIDTFANSSDAATIQSLQKMAADLRGSRDINSQLDQLATLSWRAQALGQGDTRIEQIAYEDSVEPLLAETTHPSVRWVAALLRPEEDFRAWLTTSFRRAASALPERSSANWFRR